MAFENQLKNNLPGNNPMSQTGSPAAGLGGFLGMLMSLLASKKQMQPQQEGYTPPKRTIKYDPDLGWVEELSSSQSAGTSEKPWDLGGGATASADILSQTIPSGEQLGKWDLGGGASASADMIDQTISMPKTQQAIAPGKNPGILSQLGGFLSNPSLLQALVGIAASQGKYGGARGKGMMDQINLNRQMQLEEERTREAARIANERFKLDQERYKNEIENQEAERQSKETDLLFKDLRIRLDNAKYESDQFASAEQAIKDLAKDRDFTEADSVTSYLDATEAIITNRGISNTTNAEALRSYAKSLAKLPQAKKPSAETMVSLAERAAKGDETAAEALNILNQRSVNQYDLAIKAAKGDPDAQKALELINKTNSDSKVVQIRTTDANGKDVIRFVRAQEGATYPASGPSDKPPSQAEKIAFKFWERGTAAENVLSSYEDIIRKYGFLDQLNLEKGNSLTQNEVMQQYSAAMRQFIEARLRKDSGAAIPEEEFKNERKMYFAQPGDSQETIRQKQVARRVALNAIARESGKKYREEFGEEPPAPEALKPIPKKIEKGQIIKMKSDKGDRKGAFMGGDPNDPKNYKDIGPWGGE